MAEVTLFDNDAVLKLSAYRCWELVAATDLYPPAILAVAQWSLASQVRKANKVVDADRFREAAGSFLASCSMIEPTETEIQLALDIEEAAIELGGELDSGESQLIAILKTRDLPRMVTGDKRAIKGLALTKVDGIAGRIHCLEQVLLLVVTSSDWQEIRSGVCAEHLIDRAVAMTFSCHSDPTFESVVEGLESYVRDLRKGASTLLAG